MSSLSAQKTPPLPSNLREFREKAKLSQMGLARRCGLSLKTIERLERGGSPTLSTARKIASALAKTVTAIWPELDGHKP